MIKPVIQYINIFMSQLGLRTYELSDLTVIGGLRFPTVYIKNGESDSISLEVNSCYHRLLSGPTPAYKGLITGKKSLETRSYKLRLVSVFDNNLFCVDDQYAQDKMLNNIAFILKNNSIKEISQALKLMNITTTPLSSLFGSKAAKSEMNVDKDSNVNLNFVTFDYAVDFSGASHCFPVVGCEDVPLNVLQLVKDEICSNSNCVPGTVNLNAVPFGTVPSGGTLAGLVQYVDGTPVGSLVGAIWTIPDPVCDPATITVNGQAYSSVPSGGFDNIPVLNSQPSPVGTVSPGGEVRIGDAIIFINSVAVSSAPAEANLFIDVQYVNTTPVGSLVGSIWTIPNPIACKDVTTTVNSSAYSTLPSGGTQNVLVRNSLAATIGVVTPGVGVDIGNMTIDYPDGTTAAVVVVPGGTIVTAPLWSIQLSGAVASPVTVTAPAWDSSFVCSAQTPTGGSITQITVNGGSPVASLVGVAIPASAVLVFTFTGSLTRILLSF